MKTLYILRHAQAGHAPGGDDKSRPLSEDGKTHAGALAKAMEQNNNLPDIIICSGARRTRETAAFIGENIQTIFEDDLYLASTGQLYERIKTIDNAYNSAMIVGHNPGIHGLAGFLADETNPALKSKIIGMYPPGCLTIMQCPHDNWAAIMPRDNKIESLLLGEQLA